VVGTTATGQCHVHFCKVTKRFGTRTVLDGFNLEVPKKEKLALIGPSGSGKSTVLRILMTLEDVQQGDVLIGGEYLWRHAGAKSEAASEKDRRRIRQRVGMVFQQFNLFPHMTAVRNIAEAPIKVLGLPREEAYAQAISLLDKVGLRDKADAYPAFLPGGQQQRVAIARTLAMKPEIILLDEVTSALDPELVGEVLNVIRLIAQESDLTILIVTHQMGFAREFANRICFLENGQIIEQGPPDQFLDYPKSERTKAFLRAVLAG